MNCLCCVVSVLAESLKREYFCHKESDTLDNTKVFLISQRQKHLHLLMSTLFVHDANELNRDAW